MPPLNLDALRAFVDRVLAGVGFDQWVINPGVVAGPAILVGVFVIHLAYFRKAMRADGQQVIRIQDLTNIASVPLGSHTVIEADGLEFCVIRGQVTSCDLPVTRLLPNVAILKPRPKHRFTESVTIGGHNVLNTLICAEDLTVGDATHFHAPVKVGGDLIVTGNAYFDQPVVVNGVLTIEGHATFARGVIAKGDVVALGDITIGTRDLKGWAVFRSLTLRSRLKLNGQIIADQEIALPKAA